MSLSTSPPTAKSTAATEVSPHELGRGDKTNMPSVMVEVTQAITDLGNWINTARSNEETMLALWDGQSDDGKKWSRFYGRQVFPWEGSADTRVRLADDAVDELTMLQMTAFFGANLRAVAMEAHDADAAGRVQTLMNYEIKQRMYAELWDEMNFAVQWKEAFGHSIAHIGWEKRFVTGKETITIDDLARMMAEANLMQMTPEDAANEDVQQYIIEASAVEVLQQIEARDEMGSVVALLEEKYPLLSEKRLRQILKDLQAEGVAEFRNPVELPGKPSIRALMPGIDVIYPWWVDRITRSPWVAVVEKFSEPELRSMVKREDWNQEFVDAVIANGPTRIIDVAGILTNLTREVDQVFNRGAQNTYQKKIQPRHGSFEVLRIYLQTVDEDGFPATQEIVMHPNLTKDNKPFVAKDQIYDSWFPGGCFVDLRREWKTRALMESRGVPELSKTPQWEIKNLRDARIDRTHLATNPPMRVSPRRMAGGVGGANARNSIMPGVQIASANGEKDDFLSVPPLDQGNLEAEGSIRRDHASLLGLDFEGVSPAKIQMHKQFLVNGFLISCREILLRILAADQQMMSPIQVSRVIGSGAMPFTVTREEIAGQYDITLAFDVKSLDAEYFAKRWEVMERAFKIDRSGALQDVSVLRYLLALADPNLADIAIGDAASKMQQEIAEEKQAIAALMQGIEIPPPEAANAQLRLDTCQKEIQINPKVAAVYYQDPAFHEAMNARMNKWDFDLQQRGANAQTGRTGWKPTVKEPTAVEMLNQPASPAAA